MNDVIRDILENNNSISKDDVMHNLVVYVYNHDPKKYGCLHTWVINKPLFTQLLNNLNIHTSYPTLTNHTIEQLR